jgi:hypothetical protein
VRALGGVGGVLFAVGAIGFGIERRTEGGSAALGIVLSLAVFAVGYVGVVRTDGALRAAALAALVVAVPAFWSFATGDESFSDTTAALLASALTWALLWVLGPTRSHGLLLGVALVGLWLWVVAESADNGLSTDLPSGTETATVSLAVGLVYAAVAVMAERRRLRAVAATFLAVGSVAIATGAIVIGDEESAALGGVIGIVVGLGYVWIGDDAVRRYTTWVGAAGVGGGLAAIVSDVGDDDGNLLAALLLVAGLVALGLALVVADRFGGAPSDAELERASRAAGDAELERASRAAGDAEPAGRTAGAPGIG